MPSIAPAQRNACLFPLRMQKSRKPCRIRGLQRASEGSRTPNPRITNAVLCQLKLRWQMPSRLRNHNACPAAVNRGKRPAGKAVAWWRPVPGAPPCLWGKRADRPPGRPSSSEQRPAYHTIGIVPGGPSIAGGLLVVSPGGRKAGDRGEQAAGSPALPTVFLTTALPCPANRFILSLAAWPSLPCGGWWNHWPSNWASTIAWA